MLTYLQQVELLHAVVQQLQGALRDLPGPLQEDEQRALAGEQVAAQVQQAGLAPLDAVPLLHVDRPPQQQAAPVADRRAERAQPVGAVWERGSGNQTQTANVNNVNHWYIHLSL